MMIVFLPPAPLEEVLEDEPEELEQKPLAHVRALIRVIMESGEWAAAREEVFARDGRVCAHCGATDNLHIDHILPKSKFPHLILDRSNLQVLCSRCNMQKAARLL